MKANPRVCAIVSRFPSTAAISSSLLAAIAASGLAGCVPPAPTMPGPAQSSAPAPTPPSRPAPAPPPVADWRDAPITPGDWSYAASASGSAASFAGGLFSLRCNPQARTVTLIRAGTPRAAPASMGVTTTNASRALTATAASAGIEAVLPARDPLLDAMALSRGRFVIAVTGEQPLYIPSWTEVTRVIEDCR